MNVCCDSQPFVLDQNKFPYTETGGLSSRRFYKERKMNVTTWGTMDGQMFSILPLCTIFRCKPSSCTLERFSFECRKVIGFALSTLHDWLKKFAPLFHPIRSTTKTNRDAFACIFPRFASATCNYFEF